MPRFVDTSLRLLSQDPLAPGLSTAGLLSLASELDELGYAGLEVTGGGCFTTAVRRGLESPWERIRAIRGRVTKTPLVMALRGSFLVGNRPADDDLVRRFVLCAAESGIDVFRMHDPLNDVDDLRVPAMAVREAGGRLHAGLVYAAGPEGHDYLIEHARRLSDLGAERILLHDPAGALDISSVGDLVGRLREAAGLPVGLYAQGPGGTALAVAIEAARAGADPIATAAYPVAMLTRRPAAELLTQALGGEGSMAGSERLWGIARTIEGVLGEAASAAPAVSPHIALRAALATVPVSVVAGIERSLQGASAVDRLDEVLDEFRQVREECGYPPPAAPIGRILGQQAVTHVLTGRRWATVDDEMRRILLGEWGHPPAPIDEIARRAAEQAPEIEEVDASLAEAREYAGSLAASEEDLCLVALFGERALPLLERMRGRRAAPGEPVADAETRRVQKLIALLEDSDAGELTVEEGGVRITVRRRETPVVQHVGQLVPSAGPAAAAPSVQADAGLIQIESPMVGTFYRSANPESGPFVSEGDVVAKGQTLCILEAMKLFNELKSEHAGTLRRILVDNGSAVEFGQPLFELVP